MNSGSLIPRNTLLEEYKRACREIEKEKAKQAFLVNLTAYILVNIMLSQKDLVRISTLWLGHYLLGVRWLDRFLEDLEARAEYKAREMKKVRFK